MRHQQHMKTDLRITGKELEAFAKKNPTAVYWIYTGWGDRQLVNLGQGWFIQDPYKKPDYFSKEQVEKLPEIKVYIPPIK